MSVPENGGIQFHFFLTDSRPRGTFLGYKIQQVMLLSSGNCLQLYRCGETFCDNYISIKESHYEIFFCDKLYNPSENLSTRYF